MKKTFPYNPVLFFGLWTIPFTLTIVITLRYSWTHVITLNDCLRAMSSAVIGCLIIAGIHIYQYFAWANANSQFGRHSITRSCPAGVKWRLHIHRSRTSISAMPPPDTFSERKATSTYESILLTIPSVLSSAPLRDPANL